MKKTRLSMKVAKKWMMKSSFIKQKQILKIRGGGDTEEGKEIKLHKT